MSVIDGTGDGSPAAAGAASGVRSPDSESVIEVNGLRMSYDGFEAVKWALCGNLSGGQQRRVDVALALIGDPELVLLDEPTTGFDPSVRRSAWEMITGLRQLGKTIFLTSHFMDEPEALADRIVVLRGGEIVAQGTPSTLGGRDRATDQITSPASFPSAI